MIASITRINKYNKKTVCIKISAWENVLFAACPQTVGT